MAFLLFFTGKGRINKNEKGRASACSSKGEKHDKWTITMEGDDEHGNFKYYKEFYYFR